MGEKMQQISRGRRVSSDDSNLSTAGLRKQRQSAYSELHGEFTAEKWKRTATKSVFTATSAVDELCRAIVSTKNIFPSCKVGAEVRRLALTVAVFERSLYAYVLRIPKFRREKKKAEESERPPSPASDVQRQHRPSINSTYDSPAQIPIVNNRDYAVVKPKDHLSPSMSNKGRFFPPISPSAQSLASPITHDVTAEALPSSLSQTDVEQTNDWKHTGGIVVLLNLLSDTLRRTRHVLNSLSREHSSFFKYISQFKFWLCILPLPLIYFRLSICSTLKQFLLLLLDRLQLALGIKLPLSSFSFPDTGRDLSYSVLFILFFFFYFLYRRSLHRKLSKLRQLHSRLGVLLRLWQICISILDQTQGKGQQHQIPISQWMLEQVPPTLDSAFWYQSTWQLSILKYGLDILYCSVDAWYQTFGASKFGIPVALIAAVYYASRPRWAAMRCSEILGSPDIRSVQMAWAALDLPPLRWVCAASVLEKPEFRNRLLVEKEFFLQRDPAMLVVPSPDVEGSDTPRPTDEIKKFVKVLLLSASAVELAIHPRLYFKTSHDHKIPYTSQTVVIYLHGGGFVSDFHASHLHFVTAWAKQTDAVILYVYYSLAPENAYPVALDECYEVYKWVTRGGLGFRPSRTVLAGESTGGNLAVGMCLRNAGDTDVDRKGPDALVLAYPILNLRLNPTPSRSLFMMDAILPMNLLLQCRSVYIPSTADADTDPYLSPVNAEDRLLAKFPPTSIMVGGFDPFLDDSVDFAHRLNANGVPCRLKVYPQLPHCFLNFTPILPHARRAVDKAGKWLKGDDA